MTDLHERRERLRRWGWVSVALGLPGLGILGYGAYLAVTETDFDPGFIAIVGALLALPVALGVHMIATGWGGADEKVESAESPRARVGLGALATLALGAGAVFVISMPVCGCSIRTPAYLAAMRSDLKNLASQQEIYFSDNWAYSENARSLAFVNSDGVVVYIRASQSGWTARSSHVGLGHDVSCTIWAGAAPGIFHTGTGLRPGRPGEIVCDELP